MSGTLLLTYRPADAGPILYRCERCGRDDVADPDAHAAKHGCSAIAVRPDEAEAGS